MGTDLVSLPTPEEVLKAARTVDEIIHEEFRIRNTLPEPNLAYTTKHRSQLYLRWSKPIDGRVVAVIFLQHLAYHGQFHRFARPYQLEDPNFTSADLELIQETLTRAMKSSVRERLQKDGRYNTAYLHDYAGGRVQIKSKFGVLKFYIVGAVPETHSVLISVPMEQRYRDESGLFEDFILRKLIKPASLRDYANKAVVLWNKIAVDSYAQSNN